MQVFLLSPAGIHILFVRVFVAYLSSHSQSKILISVLFLCYFVIFDMIVACIHLSSFSLSLPLSLFILSFQLSDECVFRFSSFFLTLPSSAAYVKDTVIPWERIWENHLFPNRKRKLFILFFKVFFVPIYIQIRQKQRYRHYILIYAYINHISAKILFNRV